MNKLFSTLILVSFFSACGSNPPEQQIKIPEMVILPSGEFLMGDAAAAGDTDEGPAHSVKIKSFAISKFEVTIAEYKEYVISTGKNMPELSNLTNTSLPITNVSFNDAIRYVQWLSKKTAGQFSLPSEAQWEYAARGGSLALYSFGNNPQQICDYANIADRTAKNSGKPWQVTDCDDHQLDVAPVGSYKPNAYGLYDLQGNVWEWTLDCWHNSYQGAPSKGKAWIEKNCGRRVVRGGSYQQVANSARSSNRESMPIQTKSNQLGFRIIQKL